MINSVGALLCFLPPYSPDLTPIEKFAEVKGYLKANDAVVQATTPAETILTMAFCSVTKEIVVHMFNMLATNIYYYFTHIYILMCQIKTTHTMNFSSWSNIGSFCSLNSLSVSAPISNSECNSRNCRIYLDRMSAIFPGEGCPTAGSFTAEPEVDPGCGEGFKAPITASAILVNTVVISVFVEFCLAFVWPTVNMGTHGGLSNELWVPIATISAQSLYCIVEYSPPCLSTIFFYVFNSPFFSPQWQICYVFLSSLTDYTR